MRYHIPSPHCGSMLTLRYMLSLIFCKATFSCSVDGQDSWSFPCRTMREDIFAAATSYLHREYYSKDEEKNCHYYWSCYMYVLSANRSRFCDLKDRRLKLIVGKAPEQSCTLSKTSTLYTRVVSCILSAYFLPGFAILAVKCIIC